MEKNELIKKSLLNATEQFYECINENCCSRPFSCEDCRKITYMKRSKYLKAYITAYKYNLVNDYLNWSYSDKINPINIDKFCFRKHIKFQDPFKKFLKHSFGNVTDIYDLDEIFSMFKNVMKNTII